MKLYHNIKRYLIISKLLRSVSRVSTLSKQIYTNWYYHIYLLTNYLAPCRISKVIIPLNLPIFIISLANVFHGQIFLPNSRSISFACCSAAVIIWFFSWLSRSRACTLRKKSYEQSNFSRLVESWLYLSIQDRFQISNQFCVIAHCGIKIFAEKTANYSKSKKVFYI
jgi:hypothetical protein